MTEEQSKLLVIFEARVRDLMTLCNNLRQENSELKEQLNTLNEAYQTQIEENQKWRSKYDNLKIARVISVRQDDFAGAKKRISDLVQEVDKCIALLNE